MKKHWVLMNPGPVNVTKSVRRSLLGPDLCHRESEFADLLSSIRKKLLKIFRVEKTHEVALFTGSGTAALEAMLSSYAASKRKVLVLSNGVYGERMEKILRLHGAPVKVLATDLGEFPEVLSIEAALKKDASIRAIAMVHHETSTGMINPLDDVCRLAKRFRKVLLVDAVSSLGGEPVDLASIDLCAGSAGKCLHAYPGVSFVFASKKIVKDLSGSKPKSLYLDLWNALKVQGRNDTPFTPAVQLFYALDTALDELSRQGLIQRIASYRKKNQLLQDGLRALGLRFPVDQSKRSRVLTSVWLPSGAKYSTLHDLLKKNGFVIYAGQSKLAGRIFRVSNLGELSEKDIRRFLAVLKKILPSS